MAMTTFCDWCGELMEVPEGESPLYLRGQGHGGGSWTFHARRPPASTTTPGNRTGTRSTPIRCLGQLETFLAERAAWAHDQDLESHEWRLVPRGENQPILSPSRRGSGVGPRERSPEERERDERWRRWEEKRPTERRELIRDLLADTALTAREIAEALEREHPDMKVMAERIRPIVAKMAEGGELGREPERYRKGDSIRYRYSLVSEAAS